MCFSAPKPPDPPPLPEQQAPAELDTGQGLARAEEKRNQLLIKKKVGTAGVAPSTKNIA
jgi:hypothetical protein